MNIFSCYFRSLAISCRAHAAPSSRIGSSSDPSEGCPRQVVSSVYGDTSVPASESEVIAHIGAKAPEDLFA